jgi:hypothetical protein
MEEKIPIEIPDKNCGDASGFSEINTTPQGGDKGNVEELDRAIKRNSDVLKK